MEFTKESLEYESVIKELSQYDFDGVIHLMKYPINIETKNQRFYFMLKNNLKPINYGRNGHGIQFRVTLSTKSEKIINDKDIQNIFKKHNPLKSICFKMTDDNNSIIHNINDNKVVRYCIPY